MITRFRLQDTNPLTGLREGDIPRLVLDAMRGDLADYAWMVKWILRSNHAALACMKKLQDAFAVMDWDIKQRPNLSEARKAVADRQEEALRSAYDKIGNLKAACKASALGEFYGYAHLEKIYAGGLPSTDPRHKAGSWDVVELRPVEQWFWSKTGFGGQWLYNPEGRGGYNQGTAINLRDWIIREVDPPLADVIARAHHKMEMADDDWAQHDDTFAVPPIFIEGPPNASATQEAEFQSVAEQIVANGRGYIPNGAKVHTVTVPDGAESFSLRMGKWEGAIVLAVTRGKLTMLSEPTGIGGGASEEHEKGWQDVAAALALDVSETFQKQFDAAVLQEVTPGEPPLAYFEFARPAEEDVKAHCDNANTLASAGYALDPEELSEKTGYKLTSAPKESTAPNIPATTEAAPGAGDAKVTLPEFTAQAPSAQPNAPATGEAIKAAVEEQPPIARPSRAGEASPEIVSTALANYVGLEAKWLGPVAPLLAEVEAALADPAKTLDEIEAILQRAHDALPGMLPELGVDELAKALEEAGTPGAIQGTLDALNAKRTSGTRRAK